jgi:hypothetical protein
MYKNIKMNFLDLLPDDVMKIINRKVKDLDIITRKKERKEKKIYNKYLLLYKKYIRNVKLEHCAKMIIDIKKGSLGPTTDIDSANGSPRAGLGPPGGGPAGAGLHGSTPRYDGSVRQVGPVELGPSELNQTRL